MKGNVNSDDCKFLGDGQGSMAELTMDINKCATVKRKSVTLLSQMSIQM